MVKPLSFKGDKKVKKRKRSLETPGSTSSTQPSKANAASSSEPAQQSTEEDDSWVNVDTEIDIAGPVIIVLNTEPITCLACDALGKVFAHEVENVVDDKPQTAEPHDVRQVWVAGRVAGMEGITLKGHHGKYLSNDKFGVLSASATAVSPTETFTLIPMSDQPSAFSLQTARETFITASDKSSGTPEIRGDAENIGFPTTLRIRMQARFKPRHKVAKEEKASVKISRQDLEKQAGRKLEDDEVRKLKKAKKEGDFYEVMVHLRRKGKHDKFA